MAITWTINPRPADRATALLRENAANGAPTVVFDRGVRSHPASIPGLDAMVPGKAEQVSYLDLTDGGKEGRWYSLHDLKPESLGQDLAFLHRVLEKWLNPLGKDPSFDPEKHAGEIEAPLSPTRFLLSLYFGEKPETAEKALGGPDGVAAWRKRLRFLEEGPYRLIFEDPWFAMLFVGNPEVVLPLDAPMIAVAMSRPSVPETVALRTFEIVLDKVLSLRAGNSEEGNLDVFLANAPELARRAEEIMAKLEKAHASHPGRLVLRFHALLNNPDDEVSEVAEKTYRLSRLKYGRPSEMVLSEWKELGYGFPYSVRNVDFSGPFHRLMYGFPGPAQPPEDPDTKENKAFSFLREEGFLLGARAAPVELPEDIEGEIAW